MVFTGGLGNASRGLTRRGFLLAGAASVLATAIPGLAPRVVHACDYGSCFQTGWICVWTGWGYDWMSITDCYDSMTGQFCGEFWLDTGVPC